MSKIDVQAVIEEVLSEMSSFGIALGMHYEKLDQAHAAVGELIAENTELRAKLNGWMPISAAPMDGTHVRLINMLTGVEDVGHWCDYSDRSQEYRDQMWPEHFRNADGTWPDGEWNQEYGNGEMTHWRNLNVGAE